MSDAKEFQPLSITPIQFSLTEGTAIPAPPDTPPRPPTPGRGPLDSHPTTPVPNGDGPTTAPAENPTASSKPSVQPTHSPPPNRRMSSVRKLLSLRKSNSSRPDLHAQNGAVLASSDSIRSSRPPSPLASPTSPHSLSRKKSAGWFHSGRRRSGMSVASDFDAAEDRQQQHRAVPRGPPPPTIPEFREFRSLDGELDSSLGGGELFKDIK